MLGFLIGTACLIGLIRTLRRGRFGGCHGGYGYGGGCGQSYGGGCGHGGGWHEGHHHGHEGHGGWRGFGGPPWARGGFGRNFILRSIFQRLDATPGQEKVIASAFEELKAEVEKHRSELRQSRADIAKAIRSEHFDEVLFGELFARQDVAIESLRKAGMGAIAKVHAVLEPRQREQFAEIVEGGLFRGFGGGGHRGPGAWV